MSSAAREHWREEELVKWHPIKFDEILDVLRIHGDLDLAADRIGVSREAIRRLAVYNGDDEVLLEAALALQLAQQEGRGQQKEYAKRLFIAGLAQRASVEDGLTSQKWYSREFFYQERGRDPAFDAEWELAVERAVDRLRTEAWRRGVDGVEEPVVYQGGLCYEIDRETGERRQIVIRRFSDNLLQSLLKRYDPQFRERIGVDQTASIEGGLTQDAAMAALGRLSSDELEALTHLLDAAEEASDGPATDPDR
jgi:hypothetical protein